MLFSKIFTPNSSTTKVKLIGRLLCAHIPGVLLEVGIHKDLGVLIGHHMLLVMLVILHTLP